MSARGRCGVCFDGFVRAGVGAGTASACVGGGGRGPGFCVGVAGPGAGVRVAGAATAGGAGAGRVQLRHDGDIGVAASRRASVPRGSDRVRLSCVYILATAGLPTSIDRRPSRPSHAPSSFSFYPRTTEIFTIPLTNSVFTITPLPESVV